jgi:hypothetical protein
MAKKTLEEWLYSIRRTLKEDIVINLLVSNKEISFLSAHSNKQIIEAEGQDQESPHIPITEVKGGIGYIG